jgi:hypothetical protein
MVMVCQVCTLELIFRTSLDSFPFVFGIPGVELYPRTVQLFLVTVISLILFVSRISCRVSGASYLNFCVLDEASKHDRNSVHIEDKVLLICGLLYRVFVVRTILTLFTAR